MDMTLIIAGFLGAGLGVTLASRIVAFIVVRLLRDAKQAAWASAFIVLSVVGFMSKLPLETTLLFAAPWIGLWLLIDLNRQPPRAVRG